MSQENLQTTASWTLPLSVNISLGLPVRSIAAVASLPLAAEQSAVAAEGTFARSQPNVFTVASRRFEIDSLAAAEFGWPTALAAALCSSLAYEVPAQVIAVTTDWGFRSCETVSIGDTQCFVAATEDAIVVSFRGTQEIADWLINLNTFSTATPYGRVHRGFYAAFQSVRPRIEQLLDQLGADDRKVLITGHSLGGALATIAAAEWHDRHPASSVYTFGQPAVGLTNFRDWFRLNTSSLFTRFVNDDDIVPRVPPGYRHVGRLYHFDSRGRVDNESTMHAFEAATETEPPTMSEPEFDLLKTRLEAARDMAPIAMNETVHSNFIQEGLFPSVADHSMDRYIAKVLGQLP